MEPTLGDTSERGYADGSVRRSDGCTARAAARTTAPIVKGYRFNMDEREGENARHHRLETLGQEHGVWRYQIRFSCMEVRPKDIPVTEHNQAMKREAIKRI